MEKELNKIKEENKKLKKSNWKWFI
jgi:hypothetical protein